MFLFSFDLKVELNITGTSFIYIEFIFYLKHVEYQVCHLDFLYSCSKTPNSQDPGKISLLRFAFFRRLGT